MTERAKVLGRLYKRHTALPAVSKWH